MKGGDHLSKARLIYFAVFATLTMLTLLSAMGRLFPDGPHDGSQI
jgi:hypothetical protein